MTDSKWPPLDLDFPKTYKTLDEYEEVRVILNPVEAQQSRRDLELPAPFDDGVRLNTPEAHRRQAVEELQAALQAAIRHAQASRGWAGAIGYHTEFRDKLSDAIGELQAAADLIDVFET
jgi:hypothetical protein